LSEVLNDLDIDMRKELAEIDLDVDLPPITVAPDELIRRLEQYDLHDALRPEPLQLFRDGHFNEAVRRASERFETVVRDQSDELHHRSGRALMAQAFRPDGGALSLSGVEAQNERDFQEGYQFLTMGMMAAIRNVFSHGDEERRPPEECFEMLMFLNWLFGRLDEAEVQADGG